MRLSLIVIAVLFLGGCLLLPKSSNLSDRMNLIANDTTLTPDEKMVRMRMIEIELEEDRTRVIGRASAFDNLHETLDRMDDVTVIEPNVYISPGSNNNCCANSNIKNHTCKRSSTIITNLK